MPMPGPGADGPRETWKPMVVCPDAEISSKVCDALKEMGLEFRHVREYPRAGYMGGLVQPGFNICFVDVASNEEQALQLIAEGSTDVPVVALNSRNDADLILRCLRRGAREFLAQATPEQIGAILERLERERPNLRARKPSRAYCVMSGKSGCGASTVAVSLAVELKRGGVNSVLLVDADTVESSISFLLKLKAGFHLGDAVNDWKRMDLDLWHRMVVPYHGVAVLPGPENPSTPILIDRATAMGLLSFWREHYEAIVVDAPSFPAPGSEFALVADEILLLTTNDLAALHATRRTIDCLEQADADLGRIKLIVNRYSPAIGLKVEEVQTAMKLAPYALLENDYKVVQTAVLEGAPPAPLSHFGRSVSELAERLMGKEKPAKKRSSLFGLLPRKA